MKGLITPLMWVAFAGSAVAAQTDAICVSNGSGAAWFFAVENPAGERATMQLGAAGVLCAATTDVSGKGTVSVFESEDAVEGCSRRVEPGTLEVMLAYSEFDRCLWSSNAD